MYYTYMLRCEDNSIYTGITTNIDRRLNEHLTKSEKCAKYTLKHTAIKLETAWESENRMFASKLEYHIKKLPKEKKELLIKDNNRLEEFIGEKIDSSLYKIYSKTRNK